MPAARSAHTAIWANRSGAIRDAAVGVMIGAERGDMARKVKKFLDDIEWAESAGFDTAWMPQVPNDFDALTMVSLMGNRTSRDRAGHRRGAAAGAASRRAGPPGVVGARRQRRTAGARRRAVAPLDRARHAGHPYEKPAAYTRDYLQVLNAALAGPGDVDVENDTFTVHNPTVLGADSPLPVLVAALGPVMLQIAGELTDGTVLWMADERAIGDHIAPRINKAAENAGRQPPRIVAGIPVCLCANSEIDAAKARANRILAEAETSPNYQRLLDRGDARDVGDLSRPATRRRSWRGSGRFADAGVTDLSVRLLPIGETRDELIASKYRTREVISQLAAEIR